jgi:hypothetical protein
MPLHLLHLFMFCLHHLGARQGRQTVAAPTHSLAPAHPHTRNGADISPPLAESLLKQEESKPQYSLQLLKIVAGSNFAITTRLAAALAFKNYVRLNYVV